MKILYTPSGRAGEYANKGYALNLFRGCTHGCKYCYVPAVMYMTKEDFHSSCLPGKNVLHRLSSDLKVCGVLSEPIFMCFTTDPYCIDAPKGITREAIRLIIESGNRVNILTKGGASVTDDFDLLASVPGNKIGATLTFWSDRLSLEWEPKAAIPSARIFMLQDAKEAGIETWASCEPVIMPEQTILVIKNAFPYVDEFKIGRWNHDKRANDIDWPDFVKRSEALMVTHGKRFMFKQELQRYREAP